jgi:hypothetical protein
MEKPLIGSPVSVFGISYARWRFDLTICFTLLSSNSTWRYKPILGFSIYRQVAMLLGIYKKEKDSLLFFF